MKKDNLYVDKRMKMLKKIKVKKITKKRLTKKTQWNKIES